MSYQSKYSILASETVIPEENHFLHILFSNKHLAYVIVNAETNVLVQLEEFYLAENQTNEEDFLKEFETLLKKIEVFKSLLWKQIHVSYLTDKFTFIPYSLYEESEKETYFLLNHPYNQIDENLIAEIIKNQEIVNLYAVPQKQLNIIKEHFSGRSIELKSHIGILINHFSKINLYKNQDFILFKNQSLLAILVFDSEKNLLLANQYFTPTPEDILYYTLLVAKEFQMSQENLKISLFGDFEIMHKEVQLLKQYIGEVNIGQAQFTTKTEHVLTQIPKHRFPILFNL